MVRDPDSAGDGQAYSGTHHLRAVLQTGTEQVATVLPLDGEVEVTKKEMEVLALIERILEWGGPHGSPLQSDTTEMLMQRAIWVMKETYEIKSR